MIKSLELWNFENHEHALFDKFSPQFNLIFGDSNAGKTSVVRALKLVAFNEFNKGQVRTGAKFCEVECITEKGKVRVKRGEKINEWIVTPNGDVPKEYTAVGVSVLEDVEEIIGLKIIKLGEIDVKANIMDQLEGHFMMSEIDGKSATGSLRAQIVDEISGLSGIEQLIKDIGLDNLRMSKEIKNLDDNNIEISSKLHDAALLEQEARTLQSVEVFLNQHQSDSLLAAQMAGMFEGYDVVLKDATVLEAELSKLLDDNELTTIAQLIDQFESTSNKSLTCSKLRADAKETWEKWKNIKAELDSLVPTKAAEPLVESAQNALETLKEAIPCFNAYSALNTLVGRQQAEFSALPDTNTLSVLIGELEEWRKKTDWMNGYITAWLDYEESIEDKTAILNKLPDVSGVDTILNELSENIPIIERLMQIKNEFDGIIRNIKAVEQQLETIEIEYHTLEKDNESILNEFDACPFCEQEIISNKIGV